jgi:hypothetical protein
MPQYQYLNININIKAFWSLTEAHVVISDWKHDYNPPTPLRPGYPPPTRLRFLHVRRLREFLREEP